MGEQAKKKQAVLDRVARWLDRCTSNKYNPDEPAGELKLTVHHNARGNGAIDYSVNIVESTEETI